MNHVIVIAELGFALVVGAAIAWMAFRWAVRAAQRP